MYLYTPQLRQYYFLPVFYMFACLTGYSLAPALEGDTIVDKFLCSADFVKEQLASIRLHCASGLDKLPVRFLRALSPVIMQPLATVTNRCISESTWPVIWKRPRMAPVLKVSAPSTAAEFRPVSILPTGCSF